MQLSEIAKQKWKVSDKLEIDRVRASGFERVEQEFHINLVASGFEFPDQEEMIICCSIQKYILKLARNPSFKLSRALISCDLKEGNDKVLQVMGVIYDSGLLCINSQRKRRTPLTEEQKQVLRDRLATIRQKRQ
jgi:hypothetical protein